MASNRNKFLPYTNLSTSSQITVLNGNGDLIRSSQIGDATAFFQNRGFLGGGGGNDVPKFEFPQSGFPQSPLVESVEYYERHVFLCYKDPPIWPPHIEAAEFDRLPRLLSAAFLARKGKMEKQTRLTICEGHDGTETSNGDVLIFPDMIRYRRLTHFDVDTFVEEVLVKESEWLPGAPEALRGCFIFVCAHASRDRRCGVCGPAVITRFKEEIELNGLQGKVSVSPCSHIGGHKYAGNVIIFGSNFGRQVTGHWYGNVTPDDVPLLLEQHISKGEIVDSLWRGQMGLSEEDQKRSQEARIQQDGKPTNTKAPAQTNDINNAIHGSQDEAFSCCQMNANSCCQNLSAPEKMDNPDLNRKDAKLMPEKKPETTKMSHNNSGKGPSTRKMFTMPTWFEDWEREDTYAALSVVVAALSVAFAYRCYKQLN